LGRGKEKRRGLAAGHRKKNFQRKRSVFQKEKKEKLLLETGRPAKDQKGKKGTRKHEKKRRRPSNQGGRSNKRSGIVWGTSQNTGQPKKI